MKFSKKNIENWRSWKMTFFWVGHFFQKKRFIFSQMKNNLGVHMRYHLFPHYEWFLQNLGKDFIPSIMHKTVFAEGKHYDWNYFSVFSRGCVDSSKEVLSKWLDSCRVLKKRLFVNPFYGFLTGLHVLFGSTVLFVYLITCVFYFFPLLYADSLAD